MAKGFHCDPYEAQFIFYNPYALTEVARGEREPWLVIPYAVLRPQDHFWPACRQSPAGVVFDRENGILYVVQTLVDSSDDRLYWHMIHVYKFN